MRAKFFGTALLLFFIQLGIYAQTDIRQKLIGKWEAVDAANELGSFEFLDSINIILTIPGQPTPPGTYTINASKNPMWLDIKIGNLTLKSLVKFVDANTLRWQAFFDGKRPDNFVKETSENTAILKRKKNG